MLKIPSFSVVIPCYRDGELAIEAINSAINQIGQKAEIIFVDDGSPDNSYDLVASNFKNSSNVKCYQIKNGGVSAARNFGIGKCSGDYVIFLDSDDLLSKNYLKSALTFMQKEKINERTVILMPFRYFGMENTARARWLTSYRPPMLGKFKFANLFKLSVTNCFPISSAIVPRKLVKNRDFFQEKISHYEDWELWLYLASENAAFRYVEPREENSTLIRIRQGVSSDSSRMLEARDVVAKIYFDGTPMALWRVPMIGDTCRRMVVGLWKTFLKFYPKHPNLTGRA